MTRQNLKDIAIPSLLFMSLAIFIWGLGQALLPLIFSLLLAYASLPIVKKLEARGLTRLQAAFSVLVIVLLALVLLILLIIPPLVSDLKAAIVDAPRNLSVALAKLDEILSEYGVHVPYDRASLTEFAQSYSEKISTDALNSVGSFLQRSLSNAASLLVVLMNVLLIPVFFIYLLSEYDRFFDTLEKLVPPAQRPGLRQFFKKCDVVLSGYIRGQMLVCAILSVLYTAVLLIFGVKFAIIIGMMTGFLSIIPYVGYSLGFGAALITTFANFEGAGTVVGVIIGYNMVQALESFLITPNIVGDKVGLTPLEAILFLIVMGNIFGFIGLFFAIPIGAIAKILMRNLMAEYKKTSLYKA